MAKYYMEEVFSLKDGGYDFAPFEYEDDPFEYEDDEEVKEAFSDYEYIVGSLTGYRLRAAKDMEDE